MKAVFRAGKFQFFPVSSGQIPVLAGGKRPEDEIIFLRDADCRLFNSPIMLILNITAGLIGLILTLSTLK
jgi:hypothetical protein